jgi:membrane peptidoglycan carboxypeptidase
MEGNLLLSLMAWTPAQQRWLELSHSLERAYRHYREQESVRGSIPPVVRTALVLAEDRRFWQHSGIDFVALGRVAWRFMSRGELQGGSTLEQQLVRIVTGRNQRKLSRKVVELILATLVQRIIPKEDIPGVYLHLAYFGWRMNGFRDACIRLRLNPPDIDFRAAAELVARLKYPQPRTMSPARAAQLSRRVGHITALMTSNHMMHRKLHQISAARELANPTPTLQNDF